jgi:hypothetical protein
MFRCATARSDWYLKRNLAKVLDDGTVQLLFEPKGKGHHNDAFYLEEKETICVVCGSADRLTKHHCVPYCYRRWFPPEVKTRDHHDIVLLCDECHRRYERIALVLKKDLATKYNDPLGSETPPDQQLMRMKGYASALKRNLNGEVSIPESRIMELSRIIAEFIGHDPSPADLDTIIDTDTMQDRKPHGATVVSHAENLQEFIEMWRRHFITTMQPQHLSAHWQIEKRARHI